MPSEYVKVADANILSEESIVTIPGIDRVEVCLVRYKGKFFAVSGVCTHKGAPLCMGKRKGKYLVCPWHSAAFSVETGRNTWPADRGLRSFEVKVEGGAVYVKIPEKRRTSSWLQGTIEDSPPTGKRQGFS